MPVKDTGPVLRATIDRFEETVAGTRLAVLVFDDGQQLNVPASALPRGSRQGDVVRVLFQLDREETRVRLERVRRLQQQVFSDQ